MLHGQMVDGTVVKVPVTMTVRIGCHGFRHECNTCLLGFVQVIQFPPPCVCAREREKDLVSSII